MNIVYLFMVNMLENAVRIINTKLNELWKMRIWNIRVFPNIVPVYLYASEEKNVGNVSE